MNEIVGHIEDGPEYVGLPPEHYDALLAVVAASREGFMSTALRDALRVLDAIMMRA